MLRERLIASIFFALCVVAAFAPLSQKISNPRPALPLPENALPEWPSEIDGRSLFPLPLSAGNARFASDFPGKIQESTDGERDYILRWVTAPTRMLHSSADCLRGSGYTITPGPVWRDPAGIHWSTFLAHRENRSLRVRERISDQAGHHWTDLSSWYWSAIMQKSTAPWLAVTVVEFL
jgi:hypothetical protein